MGVFSVKDQRGGSSNLIKSSFTVHALAMVYIKVSTLNNFMIKS